MRTQIKDFKGSVAFQRSGVYPPLCHDFCRYASCFVQTREESFLEHFNHVYTTYSTQKVRTKLLSLKNSHIQAMEQKIALLRDENKRLKKIVEKSG